MNIRENVVVLSVRSHIAVGAACLVAIGGTAGGAVELAGHDVLGAEAIGEFVGEQNATSHNKNVRSCAKDWVTNVKAAEIVVGDCLYTLSYREKTPSPTPVKYLKENIISPAEIEERSQTFGARARVLGGLGGIAAGGLAAGILGLRRMYKRDRGPLDSDESGGNQNADPSEFTVAAAIGPWALMYANDDPNSGGGPKPTPQRKPVDPIFGFAVG